METPQTEKIRESFAKILRKKRKEKSWSQEELAARAGLAMRYVSLLECQKRQPTISTMYALCEALGVSMSEFIQEVEKEGV